MASRLWQNIEARRAQRAAKEASRISRLAEQWAQLSASFRDRAAELETQVVPMFRNYDLPAPLGYPEEFAWWPAGNIADNETALLAAAARRDIRISHVHGGPPQGNPALATLRLIDRAAEAGGDDAAMAMFLRALLHDRLIWRVPARHPEHELIWEADAACRSVHPALETLQWTSGSKHLLPMILPQRDPADDFEALGRILAEDAAALLKHWTPIRVRETGVSFHA